MPLIDAHQHYWNPARGDYGWMPKDDPILSRPYGPADLAPEIAAHDITHTVLVQAAPSIEETEYMLGLADATPHVAAVVGWIDFEKPADLAHLKRFAAHPKFAGVRPMIQDIPDDGWMLREDVQWAFRAVSDLGLTFDALGFPRHLANFHTLFTRYPDLRVVVDHCMKPQIRTHSEANFRHWADGISRLADTGAYAKFSALVTEANPDWTVADLQPYVEHVFAAFGAERVMWGSDWPVVRLRCEYPVWRAAAEQLAAGRTEPQKGWIFGGTASAFYRLGL